MVEEYNFPKDRWLLGDSHRITQILLNVISNALKFTKEGMIKLIVREKMLKNKMVRLEFEVSDTGIGIPPESISKQLHPFTQVQSGITRKYGGTGLGLTISRELIKMMNGDITITSTVGKGTTVKWYIIVFLENPPETEIPDNGKLGKRHVLVVEDNLVNQRILYQILNSRHFCECASDGKDAIEKCSTTKYDIIFMDLMMPELSGFETAKIILSNEKSMNFHTPIVALTASVDPETKKKAFHVGMCDFLVKPATSAQIFQTILKYSAKQ